MRRASLILSGEDATISLKNQANPSRSLFTRQNARKTNAILASSTFDRRFSQSSRRFQLFQFSDNKNGSGDDPGDDEEDIEETFFGTTEKEIDELITKVVTIGTDSYETTVGSGGSDYDYGSASGDGEEYDSIYIPEIIRNDLFIQKIGSRSKLNN